MSQRKKRSAPITAGELAAQRAADPEYQAMRERNDAVIAAQAEIWRSAQRPLLHELRAAGYEIDSVWDLVNTSTPYPAALPILLDHLQRAYPNRVRDGIARALAVRPASFGWPILANEYRNASASDIDVKQGLAAALAETATRDTEDELIELIRDPVHGESRLILLTGLRRLRTARGREVIKSLTSDPVLGQEASRMPRKRK
jgi:hypothetical protein